MKESPSSRWEGCDVTKDTTGEAEATRLRQDISTLLRWRVVEVVPRHARRTRRNEVWFLIFSCD
jgi:hypothetical protein